jgi:hypothetical protein
VANTSANICGIPTSSIEKAKLPLLLLSLNLAIDVCVGPLLASTLYFVGFIIPKKSPFVENFVPRVLLRLNFFDFNKSSVEPKVPAATITLLAFMTLVSLTLSCSVKSLIDEKSDSLIISR